MTRLPRLLAALVASAALALTAAFAAFHPFDDDEFQHAHYAWLLHRGQLPFRDFFEHHLPAYHALAAPAYAVIEGPESLFVIRFLSWACYVATLACAYGACRALCSGRAGPIAAVLLLSSAPMFLGKMVEARPEAPALLCFTASLWLLLRGGADKGRGMVRVVVAGVLAGAMPAVSHKFALPAAALALGAFRLAGARKAALFAAAFTLPLLAVLAWAAAHGIFHDLIHDVFVLGVQWKHRFAPSGYLVTLWTENALLVVSGIAGLLLLAAGHAPARRAAAVILPGLAAAILTIFLVPEPYRQSFLPLFPLLAAGASVTADRLFACFFSPASGARTGETCTVSACASSAGIAPSRGIAVVALVALAAAAMYPAAISLAADLRLNPAADVRRMRTAVSTGSPRFFDGRALVFYRPHTGRYAFMHQGVQSMLDPAAFAAETVAAIREAGFPTAVLDYRVAQMPPPVLEFLYDHYLPLADDVWVPGFRIDRSRLAGRSCRRQVPVGGIYRISWRGGAVFCDGNSLAPGVPVALAAGEHEWKGAGFVEDFEARLLRRLPAGAETAP